MIQLYNQDYESFAHPRTCLTFGFLFATWAGPLYLNMEKTLLETFLMQKHAEETVISKVIAFARRISAVARTEHKRSLSLFLDC